jgi:hypothetical protein
MTMHSHRFDPVSAVLGLVSLVAAILVMVGSATPFDADVGPWLALVALAFGLVLLPWGIRAGRTTERPTRSAEAIDPVGASDPIDG